MKINKIKLSLILSLSGLAVYCLIVFFQFSHQFNIHTDSSRGGINEHIDFDFNFGGFNITHDIKKDNGELIISEGIKGIYLRDVFSGSYYLYPTSFNDAYSDLKHSGSLTKIGKISLCEYNIGNQRVIFLEEDRGTIEIAGKNLHLSSVFTGEDRKHEL